MAYKHVDKESGQLIRADDWNAMGRDLERLEGAKVQRNGGDAIDGDLKVTGSLELGRGQAIKEFSTDKKLGDNSDLALPTESAVKSYVDDALKQKAALDGAPGQDFQTRRLSVSDNLHLAKDQEIFFADNGQIRSRDDNHRILFRRSSDKMELREYGDITFSPGATAGKETARVVMSASGNVGIGTDAPETRLDVRGDVQIAGTAANLYKQYKIELMGSAFESKDGNKTYLKIDDKARKMTNSRGLNTVTLNPDGTFKKNAAHDVYGNRDQWNKWADWVNTNAEENDVVAVASFDAIRNAPKGGSAEGLLNSICANNAFQVERGSQRSPYVLLFIKGGSYSIEVSQPYKGPNALLKTTSQNLARLAKPVTLELYGAMIQRVAVATGLGPGDQKDNGQIESRFLNFNKFHNESAIRILYCDNLRIRGGNCSARWEIRIDGKAPPNGPICQDKYHDVGNNVHEPATIIGYATEIPAGRHQIQVWVVSPVPGHPTKADAYTGWLNSRWTIEAQEVWL